MDAGSTIRPSLTDRVADVVFVVFMLALVLPAQVVFPIGYSPTRDIYFLYLLVLLGLLGQFWLQVPRRVTVAITVLAMIMLAGQISWTWQWDSGQANNYWQGSRLMLASLVFGAAFGSRRWELWRRILVGFGLALALLQAVVLMLGPVAAPVDEAVPAEFYRYRPISAEVALLMAVAFVLILVRRAPTRLDLAAAAFLGVSVVVSQHRSAWVAMAVILVLLGIQALRRGWGFGRGIPLFATAACWVIAVVLPVVTGRGLLPGSGVDAEQGLALPTTVTSSGTLEWRVEMWRSRLQAPRSLIEVLLGGAFGPTSALGPDAVTMNPYNSAHNLLLDQFIMVGLVGIVCLGLLVFTAVLARTDLETGIPVALAGAIGYGFFYNWPVWLWLLVGVSCGMVSGRPRARARTHEPRTEVAA